MLSPASRFRPHPTKTRANATRLARTFWIFSVTVLLASIGGAATTPAVAVANTPAAITNPAQMPEPVLWRPCPINGREQVEHRLVRPFQRAPGRAVAAVMPGGTSDLVCGHPGYGYYHIVNRHYVDWNQKSILTSENWREVADYSIAETLKNPAVVTFRAENNTFCYSREIYLVNKVRGLIVDVMYPNVVVRVQDGRIITAFPAGEHCT